MIEQRFSRLQQVVRSGLTGLRNVVLGDPYFKEPRRLHQQMEQVLTAGPFWSDSIVAVFPYKNGETAQTIEVRADLTNPLTLSRFQHLSRLLKLEIDMADKNKVVDIYKQLAEMGKAIEDGQQI